VRVQHRHIIYIQGYDPRGLAQYYRMFRTELRKFSRLYSSRHDQPPKVASDDEIASWTIETKASDWQTRTAYDFLRSRISSSTTWRADLAHGVPCGLDLLAARVSRHHRTVRQGELAFRDLHHLPAFAAAARGRMRAASPLCSRRA
jgi:hypothetical protein